MGDYTNDLLQIDFSVWKVRLIGMKKNQIIPYVTIDKVGYEGIGLATFENGKKLIIKGGALPGMICDLRVVKNYKDYAECHIVEIHSFAPEYQESNIKCPHYLYSHNDLPICKTWCGWCKWQIADYDTQLTLKNAIVQDSFRRYPYEVVIRPVLPSPEIWGYRNKIEYSFGKFISWRWADKQILSDRSLGFHRQGMFGKIVDIDQCFLVDQQVNKLFQHVKNKLKDSGIPVYDQMMHDGVLRHLMIRQAKRNSQIMCILSVATKGDVLDTISRMLEDDQYIRSHVTTFVLIINNWLADVVATRDSEFITLWWEGIINERLCIGSHGGSDDFELSFDISPQSFFQTNSTGAELLYSTAAHMSKLALWEDITWTIMDLYCGTGTIGLCFLKRWIGRQLIGIEEIPAAIEDAQKNALRNNIYSDYYFFAWKVEKTLTISDSQLLINNGELVIEHGELKMIIVDPPRSGLHSSVIDVLVELKKTNNTLKICYISCNPVTLARDLTLLSVVYRTDYIQPIDMFPHTHHIENIVILQ